MASPGRIETEGPCETLDVCLCAGTRSPRRGEDCFLSMSSKRREARKGDSERKKRVEQMVTLWS